MLQNRAFRVENGADDAERGRAQRQRMFQFGLIVCLALLILDARTTDNSRSIAASRTSSQTQHNGGLGDFAPKTIAEDTEAHGKLISMLSKSKGSSSIYPANVSGTYRGFWKTLAKPTNGTAAANATTNHQANLTKGAKVDDGSKQRLNFHSAQGRITLQIRGFRIASIPDLHYVYGGVRVFDGGYATTRDIIAPVEGVFIRRMGALALVTKSDDADLVTVSWNKNLDTDSKGGDSGNGKNGGKGNGNGTAKKTSPQKEDDSTNSNESSANVRRLTSEIDEVLEEIGLVDYDLGMIRTLVLEDVEPDFVIDIGDDPSLDIFAGLKSFFRSSKTHAPLLSTRIPPSVPATLDVDEPHGRQLREARSEALKVGATNSSLKVTSLPVGASNLVLSSLSWTKPEPVEQRAGELRSLVATEKWDRLLAVRPANAPAGVAIASSSTAKQCTMAISLSTAPIAQRLIKNPNNLKLGKGSDADTIASAFFASSVNGQIYSSDCNFVSNTTASALNIDMSKAYSKAVRYSVVMTMMCIAQVAGIILQLRYSRTQAAASKVSVLGIAFQAILDAIICVVHLLLCAALPQLFTAFVTVALFKLVIFCVFEIRYILMIYQARFAQEVALEGWPGLRRRMAILHARFYVGLFAAMIAVYVFRSFPTLVILLFYSYWVPQIVFSAYSGVRKPLHLHYVILMSASRLFLPLYFYGCPYNFFAMFSTRYTVDYTACTVAVLWTLAQVAVLVLQDMWGPRFFVPPQFIPPKYNYRRHLPRHLQRQDVESELVECVICYNGVETAHQDYMVTPCDHLFHSECLTQWLGIKLECPVCRAALPQLDED